MSLVGFKANNHPQQVGRNGADDEVDDRGTPQDFWDELDAEHHFTLDVAAAAHNAKTEHYYSRSDNGLAEVGVRRVTPDGPMPRLGEVAGQSLARVERRTLRADRHATPGKPLRAGVVASAHRALPGP